MEAMDYEDSLKTFEETARNYLNFNGNVTEKAAFAKMLKKISEKMNRSMNNWPLYGTPKLNNEILNDIFVKAVPYYVDDEEFVMKFMMSGKEPFQIVLNHFKHVVNVFGNCVTFRLKRHENGFILKYKSPLLKFLIPLIAMNYEELIIDEWPYQRYVNKVDLTTLLKENFKTLKIERRSDFPNGLLMQCNKFEILESYCHRKFYDIIQIPPSCRKLVFYEFDFNNFLNQEPYDLSFHHIEELIIDAPDYEFEDLEYKAMDGPIHYYFDNVKLMIISNVLALVIVITLFITPILHDATSIPILQAALIKDIPILSNFFQLHPNAAGYHINFITDWFDLLGYDSVIFGAFLPIAFLTMHLIFRWRMKKLKNIFNKNTIKAHKMLYRALTVQFLISIILLFTPLIIFMGTYLSQIKNGTIYASLAINIGGLEPIFNCLSMLYFIRPYRKYVIEKFQTYIYSGSNNHLPTNLERVMPSVFTTEG